MFGPEFILAQVLLIAPLGSPIPDIDKDQWPPLQNAIQSLAIDWEILDQREIKYVLIRLEDFKSDLELLRKRYIDLQGVPRIADCNRFPERTRINEMLSFNRNFRKSLEIKQNIEADRADDYGAVIRETDQLYQVWDCVRDARCDFYYITVRRQALKKLQYLLGPNDYFANRLPPSIPTWRFRSIN